MTALKTLYWFYFQLNAAERTAIMTEDWVTGHPLHRDLREEVGWLGALWALVEFNRNV